MWPTSGLDIDIDLEAQLKTHCIGTAAALKVMWLHPI